MIQQRTHLEFSQVLVTVGLSYHYQVMFQLQILVTMKMG